MNEDIIERLRDSAKTFNPDSRLGRLISDAISEIEFLRTHAGAVTRGDSFDDIMRKTGPRRRGEMS